MDYLPLHFDLDGRPCLLVGGGDVALRRALLLLSAGARLRVVAPDLCAQLAELREERGFYYRAAAYEESDLEDVNLVVAATSDREVNRQVSEDARRRNIPVNVVDQRELCTVIFPAIVDRSPVVISLSSSANSPVLARKLREKLESIIPAGYGRLADFIGRHRERLKESIGSSEQRRKLWEWVIDGPVGELVFAEREDAAEELLLAHVSSPDTLQFPGEVALVGAGPGDPDLLTFKALRLMQQADVVLYDTLVSDEILNLVRRDARKEDVGKRGDRPSRTQDSITARMVALAREGKRVVRLKGGDPFIFGRGGEEIEELSASGIPFQVVPGITAATGCASYAGIPLTHREYAQSVRFVSARQSGGGVDLDWASLIPDNQTVVFYMGFRVLEEVCDQLVAHGASPDTPVALVAHGTMPAQEVCTGTLADIVERVRGREVEGPALIIVGEVVKVRTEAVARALARTKASPDATPPTIAKR